MTERKHKFRSVAIYCHYKPEKEKIERVFLRELIRFLHSRGVDTVHGDVRVTSMLHYGIAQMDDLKKYDLKIGIGGDGTLLKMIRTLQKDDGYLLGINFGTLGFLSELNPENVMGGLKKIFDGEFHIDERMLIKAHAYRRDKRNRREQIFKSYALNEVVFGHGGLARLTNFNLKIDRRFLSTYRSDGLIFATPTGSTAYSMSAGGPIVAPSLKNIIVTPVSPHTLTHRPIVLPADKIFHLSFDSRSESISMTTDGQVYFSLKPSDEVTIQKATRPAQFIRLRESHYFRTLRNKMGWGN
ncbi:MAG TPA: NAD(+)/NADH kinase [Candidatus Gracilibacteria bacterium]